jgi:hypothetical protein
MPAAKGEDRQRRRRGEHRRACASASTHVRTCVAAIVRPNWANGKCPAPDRGYAGADMAVRDLALSFTQCARVRSPE